MIGLLPSAVWLWEGVRAPFARRWKARNSRDNFWAGASKGADSYRRSGLAQRTIWCTCGLLAMHNFFEYIRFALLWQDDIRRFLPRLLAWVISLFSGPRLPMHKGAAYSKGMWPQRGAPAGSRFAGLALRIV